MIVFSIVRLTMRPPSSASIDSRAESRQVERRHLGVTRYTTSADTNSMMSFTP